MGKTDIINTGLRCLREGSLLFRRMQLIKKDINLSKPAKKEEIPSGGYDLNKFASEISSDSMVFKDLFCPIASSRFDLVLGVPSISCNQLWKLWQSMFPCTSPFGDFLDQEIAEGGTVKNPYLFRLYNSVEPDLETLGLSGSELRRKRINAISLPEFMIAEMFHFKATRGGHLNLSHSTLCAGTQFRDGTIPEVRFENRCVVIDWVKPTHADSKLGTRLVVKG